MAVIQPPSSDNVPTIGICALATSGSAHAARARHLAAMLGATLAPITLPGLGGAPAEHPGILVVDPVVSDVTSANHAMTALAEGHATIVLVVTCAESPLTATVQALTARLTTASIACIAAGFQPHPAAHAVVDACARAGRLCHLLIGGVDYLNRSANFTAASKAEIVDLAWAMTAAAWLVGKRVRQAGIKSPTALPFGLIADTSPHTRTPVPARELAALVRWATTTQWNQRIHAQPEALVAERARLLTANPPAKALTQPAQRRLADALATYLDEQRDLRRTGCIASGGIAHELAQTLLTSTSDHRGPKAACATTMATDRDALLTVTVFAALTGGEPLLNAERSWTIPAALVQQQADELGLRLDPQLPYLKHGLLVVGSAQASSLAWCPNSCVVGTTVIGLVPGGQHCQIGVLTTTAHSPTPTMIRIEADTVDLPAPLSEAFAHRTGYLGTHAYLVPRLAPVTVLAHLAASTLTLARSLPTRRWQYFSDYTGIINHHLEGVPEFTADVDRPLPWLYRCIGSEAAAKQCRASP